MMSVPLLLYEEELKGIWKSELHKEDVERKY